MQRGIDIQINFKSLVRLQVLPYNLFKFSISLACLWFKFRFKFKTTKRDKGKGFQIEKIHRTFFQK